MIDNSIFAFKDSLYTSKTATLTKIGERNYKISVLKVKRRKGLELPEDSEGWAREWGDKELQQALELFDNNLIKKKLDNNISRAKGKLYEYAMCNRFDWFVTFTIDEKKCPRDKLKEYWKKFSQFRDSLNKRYNIKIDYILVPEMHKDKKNWHVHGLMKGFDLETTCTKGRKKGKKLLIDFRLKDIPKRLRDSILKAKEENQNIMNMSEYSQKFGFCTLKSINYKKKESLENVAKYTTKYISKDITYCVSELGSKLYYNSQGLKRKQDLKNGVFLGKYNKNDYLEKREKEVQEIRKGKIEKQNEIRKKRGWTLLEYIDNRKDGEVTPNFENDFVRIYDFEADSMDELAEIVKLME